MACLSHVHVRQDKCLTNLQNIYCYRKLIHPVKNTKLNCPSFSVLAVLDLPNDS